MSVDRTEVIAKELAPPAGHFAHAVVGAGVVYVSGLLGLNGDGTVVGPDTVAQCRAIFDDLEKVLAASDSSLSQVVKLTTYVMDMEDRVALNEIREEYFGSTRPASSLFAVAGLAVDDARLEVDAIALQH